MTQLPLFATAEAAVAAARAAGYSGLSMRDARLSAVPVLRAAQEAYRAWREAQPGDYQRAHPLWTPRYCAPATTPQAHAVPGESATPSPTETR